MQTGRWAKRVLFPWAPVLIPSLLVLLILFLGAAPTRADRTQGELDLGDAPYREDSSWLYPTLLANMGASHVLGSGVYLGACVDAEPDGQPSAGANGDDTNIGSPVYGTCVHDSDEDGVAFLTPLLPDEMAEIAVVASAPCTLSAWIDFSADGDWSDAGEDLFPGGQGLVIGFNPLTFTVPAGAAEGYTYARFRCTTEGVVSFTGEASDGEVEDYRIRIGVDRDLGDAPDQPYPTYLTNSGASHVLGSDVYLGSCVDAELDGQPTVAANGDDVGIGSPVYGACVGGDDEDGVTFLTPLLPDETAQLKVVASFTCTLSAWIDYYSDGDWSDPIDEVFPGGRVISPGTNYLTFVVSQETEGGATYARFRCTTDGAVSFTGEASDGEVEDYPVWIGEPMDLGDAPDPTYPTLLASGGARHGLGSAIYLGTCVDAEPDGQPSTYANGDDLDGSGPSYGTCATGDDEDGVIFTTPLLPGSVAGVAVIANAPCDLYAWVDFNSDGDWMDLDERIFSPAILSAGANLLSFAVPQGATEGPTYARFRCIGTGSAWLDPTGYAPVGEVEDYLVQIGSLPLDLGDAPEEPYPTLLASTGASHVLGSGIYLGACVDAEPDGQPSPGADGDDTNIGSPVYGSCSHDVDEDGVIFSTPLYPGKTAGIEVVASAPCVLSGWIDFNADGDWADKGETLFPGGAGLAAGGNSLSFFVPPGATEGDTYARFRCTTSGATLPVGLAPDGEVEDYQVAIVAGRDFGDAPDPAYPTLAASSGASHVLGSGVYLGACVDAEEDGQPTGAADGDDVGIDSPVYGACAAGDDEDGVTFLTPLLVGGTANIQVVANASCTLSAWIDFNADGGWDAGENLFPGGQTLGSGVNVLSFTVPSGAVESSTHARFRCTTDGAVSFTGEASDGEVEDYQVRIGEPADFGDALDPTYPTLSSSGGASHVLGSGVYLGACVDAELDGQPVEGADGDDSNSSFPVYGTCAGGSDEDGVTFTTPLTIGTTADVEVVASAACTLTAWIDFNADGDWLDGGEALFPGGQPLMAGTNVLSFTVPMARPGSTYARFRCTTDGAVGPTGRASDGEVEDYSVTILGHAIDLHLPLVLRE